MCYWFNTINHLNNIIKTIFFKLTKIGWFKVLKVPCQSSKTHQTKKLIKITLI